MTNESEAMFEVISKSIENTDRPKILYPNPTNGILYIKEEINSIAIYDVNARRIKTIKNPPVGQINIDDLSDGIYYFGCQNGNKVTFEKIVVVKN